MVTNDYICFDTTSFTFTHNRFYTSTLDYIINMRKNTKIRHFEVLEKDKKCHEIKKPRMKRSKIF